MALLNAGLAGGAFIFGAKLFLAFVLFMFCQLLYGATDAICEAIREQKK